MPAFAPRENQPLPGYWGKPTSTLDFCEENYIVTFYMAEFWNTLTNVSMIIPPLVGMATSRIHGLEFRYTASYMLLLLVGIGSACFHGSLLYHMQLLDELPMLFAAVQFLYCLLHMGGPTDRWTLWSTAYLISLYSLSTIISVAYIFVGNPAFHHLAYGAITISIAFQSFYDLKIYVNCRYLGWAFLSFGCYMLAVVVWVLDHLICSQLREMRGDLGQQHPLAVFSQLHGWWHLLAGAGSFLHILTSSRIRMSHLGYNTKIKSVLGIPYLQTSGKNHKHY